MRLSRLALSLSLLLSTGCASVQPREEDDRTYRRHGPLELSAAVEVDVSDVMGAVDLMNPTGETVTVSYAGECGVAILIYDGEGTNGRPRWDSSRWWEAQGACPEGTTKMDIPPRTLARILTPVVAAPRILSDSLPAGRYLAAVRLRILEPSDSVLILPAGEIELEGAPAETRFRLQQ